MKRVLVMLVVGAAVVGLAATSKAKVLYPTYQITQPTEGAELTAGDPLAIIATTNNAANVQTIDFLIEDLDADNDDPPIVTQVNGVPCAGANTTCHVFVPGWIGQVGRIRAVFHVINPTQTVTVWSDILIDQAP